MMPFKENITKSIDNLNDLEKNINNLQEKNIEITENGEYSVEADSGYYALKRVNIDVETPTSILQTKNVTITSNDTTEIEPDEGYDGLEKVNVTTDIPSNEDFDMARIEAYAQAQQFPNIAPRYYYIGVSKIKQVIFNVGQRNINQMFKDFYSLTEITNIDTSLIVNMNNLFENCISLEVTPQLDISSLISFDSVFKGCKKLRTIRLLNPSNKKFKNMNNIVSDRNSGNVDLDNDSLHLLLGLIDTGYTGTKTLKGLGMRSSEATTCAGFDEWSSLVSAGWSTGY